MRRRGDVGRRRTVKAKTVERPPEESPRPPPPRARPRRERWNARIPPGGVGDGEDAVGALAKMLAARGRSGDPKRSAASGQETSSCDDGDSGSASPAASPGRPQLPKHLLAAKARSRSPELALDLRRSRANSKGSRGSSDGSPYTPGGMEHLAEELDGLLAEMGRQTTRLRAGQRYEMNLAAGVDRVIEVIVPRGGPMNDAGEWNLLIESSPNTQFHASDTLGLRKGLLPMQPYDLSVADSSQQLSNGPYRAQSLENTSHRIRISTDSPSTFLCLSAKRPCHVDVCCQVLEDVRASRLGSSGRGGRRRRRRSSEEFEDTDEEDGDAAGGATVASRMVGRRLEAKLNTRRQERSEQFGGMDAETFARLASAAFTSRRVESSMGVIYASAASDAAVAQQVREEQKGLEMLAVAGAAAFFLRRYREIHLTRARMAMRQLLWYKSLFAASRFRFLVLFLAEERQRIRELTARGCAAKEKEQAMAPTFTRSVSGLAGASPERGGRTVAGGSTLARQPGAPPTDLVERTRWASDSFRGGGHKRARTLRREPTTDLRSLGDGLLVPATARTTAERGACAPSQLAIEMAKAQLRAQGLVISPPTPRPTRAGVGAAAAAPPPLTAEARRARVVQKLSESLGRHVQVAGASWPSIAAIADTPADEALAMEAIKEASSRFITITARPAELSRLASSAESFGASCLRRFEHEVQQRCAGQILRRSRHRDTHEPGSEREVVRITKRYLLTFLEDPLDLRWLHLLQSLMLVIRGLKHLLLPCEQFVYEGKLQVINQARKEAGRKSGAFAPLEAAMLSHPVVVAAAARLQRLTCRSDAATAWKGTLFEGSYAEASDRDPCAAGRMSPYMPAGGSGQALRRRLVDVGGPFRSGGRVPPPPAEVLASHPPYLAARTANGHVVRAFGEALSAAGDFSCAARPRDRTLEIPADTLPKELRLEELRLRRRSRSPEKLPAPGALSARGRTKAQRRWCAATLATPARAVTPARVETPASARSVGRQLAPYFDALALAPEAPTADVAIATVRAMDAAVVEPRAAAVAPDAAQARGGEASAVRLPPAPPQRPETVKDIGKLVKEMDALRTILSVDHDQEGGAARRCPAGWISGFREEPMVEDELRRARFLERHIHMATSRGAQQAAAAAVTVSTGR